MKNQTDLKILGINKSERRRFDPFYLISDEEFVNNLSAIIAYYQIAKSRKNRNTAGLYPRN
jgi:hypothetical protein